MNSVQKFIFESDLKKKTDRLSKLEGLLTAQKKERIDARVEKKATKNEVLRVLGEMGEKQFKHFLTLAVEEQKKFLIKDHEILPKSVENQAPSQEDFILNYYGEGESKYKNLFAT